MPFAKLIFSPVPAVVSTPFLNFFGAYGLDASYKASLPYLPTLARSSACMLPWSRNVL